METKRVYKSVDFLKFLSAFAVLCLHTRPFINTPVDYYANVLFVMAVPFFFCTSSYFFHLKENNSLKKYIKRLSLLYGIWFCLELPYVLEKFSFVSLKGWCVFIWSFFLNNTFLASWFLMALIEAMIIVVLLNRRGYKAILYAVCASCFFLSLFSSMYNGLLNFIPHGETINHVLSSLSAAQSFILAIPFCVMGMKMVNIDLKISLKKELLIWSILIMLAFLEAYICKPICARQNSSLMIIPVVFMTIYICLRHDININPTLLLFMRKSSILIYLTHPVVEYVLMNSFGFVLGFKLTILTALIALLVSVLIVYLSKYIKVLKYTY